MDESELILIGGRSGVGKTTAALEMHFMLCELEVKHAFIEGDNLDQSFPTAWEYKLAERNLAAMWSNYRELGYRKLILTNTVSIVEHAAMTTAMGDHPKVTGVLLTANDDRANERLMRRNLGSSLENDKLRSSRAAAYLEERSPEWVHRIATDDLSVNQVARRVLKLAGWLPRAVSPRTTET